MGAEEPTKAFVDGGVVSANVRSGGSEAKCPFGEWYLSIYDTESSLEPTVFAPRCVNAFEETAARERDRGSIAVRDDR